ncbi:hypothetical protein K474DRAFT_1415116 [Panus rudis PR-1116 ss-1]|nr:hypothetical protein K474DRAFT_1415116 [Panus rudis PR-1116 ss-1]
MGSAGSAASRFLTEVSAINSTAIRDMGVYVPVYSSKSRSLNRCDGYVLNISLGSGVSILYPADQRRPAQLSAKPGGRPSHYTGDLSNGQDGQERSREELSCASPIWFWCVKYSLHFFHGPKVRILGKRSPALAPRRRLVTHQKLPCSIQSGCQVISYSLIVLSTALRVTSRVRHELPGCHQQILKVFGPLESRI